MREGMFKVTQSQTRLELEKTKTSKQIKTVPQCEKTLEAGALRLELLILSSPASVTTQVTLSKHIPLVLFHQRALKTPPCFTSRKTHLRKDKPSQDLASMLKMLKKKMIWSQKDGSVGRGCVPRLDNLCAVPGFYKLTGKNRLLGVIV